MKNLIFRPSDVPNLKDINKGEMTGGIILRKPYNCFSGFSRDVILDMINSEPLMKREFYIAQQEKKSLKRRISGFLDFFGDFSAIEHSNTVRRTVENFNKRMSGQHENLFDAFIKEGVPCRYFVSDSTNKASYYATDCGTLVSKDGHPKLISARFKAFYRAKEVISSELLLNKGLSIPVSKLQSKNKKIPQIYEGGDIRQMPEFNLWFMGGGIHTGTFPNWYYRCKNDKLLLEVARRFSTEVEAPVVPLKLLTLDYYHLDTCFLPLPKANDGKPWAVIFEGSNKQPTMDERSFEVLKKLYGEEHLIKITESEAKKYATNSVVVQNAKGEKCIFSPLNSFSDESKQKLKGLGFKLIEIPYEYLQIGQGSLRCTCFEVPKSLNKTVFKAQDDLRLHHQVRFLEENKRRLFVDQKSKEIVLNRC